MNWTWFLNEVIFEVEWLLLGVGYVVGWAFRFTIGSYIKRCVVRVGKVLKIQWLVKKGRALPANPKFSCKYCGDIFLKSEAMEHDCSLTVFHERLEKR